MKLSHSYKLGRYYGIHYIVRLTAQCFVPAHKSEWGDEQEDLRWEESIVLFGFGVLAPDEQHEDRTTTFLPWRAFATLLGVHVRVDIGGLAWFLSKRKYFAK